MSNLRKPREFWITKHQEINPEKCSAFGWSSYTLAFASGRENKDPEIIHVREVLPQSETVDVDLENAAERHTDNGNHVPHGKRDMPSWVYSRLDFKAGAEWQKAKDAGRIEELEAIAKRNSDPTLLVSLMQDKRDLESQLAKVREQTLKEVIDFLKTDLMSVSSGGKWARVIKSQFLPNGEDKK